MFYKPSAPHLCGHRLHWHGLHWHRRHWLHGGVCFGGVHSIQDLQVGQVGWESWAEDLRWLSSVFDYGWKQCLRKIVHDLSWRILGWKPSEQPRITDATAQLLRESKRLPSVLKMCRAPTIILRLTTLPKKVPLPAAHSWQHPAWLSWCC